MDGAFCRMKSITVTDKLSRVDLFDWILTLEFPFTISLVQHRSLSANSLCHVWFRDIAKHLTDNAESLNLRDGDTLFTYSEDDVKTLLKRYHGLILTKQNPLSGKREQVLKSLADYDKSELYDFMQKIKHTSLHIWGLHLTSIGQFADWDNENN